MQNPTNSFLRNSQVTLLAEMGGRGRGCREIPFSLAGKQCSCYLIAIFGNEPFQNN